MVTPPNFGGEEGKRMWKVIAMQGNNQVIVWFEFYDESQESFSGGARTFGWEPASLALLASNMCKSIVVQYGSSPVWTVLLTEAKWCWLLLDQKVVMESLGKSSNHQNKMTMARDFGAEHIQQWSAKFVAKAPFTFVILHERLRIQIKQLILRLGLNNQLDLCCNLSKSSNYYEYGWFQANSNGTSNVYSWSLVKTLSPFNL